jgi:hypothetical protein
LEQKTDHKLTFEVVRAEGKRATLYLDGDVIDREGDRHQFFCQVGPDFVILSTPFTPEGKEMATLFTEALGPPSREPSTKCGGGSRGKKGGHCLITSYSWEFDPGEKEIAWSRVSSILGCSLEELA